MQCTGIRFSRHAVQRMFNRSLPVNEIARIVVSGEIIEDYPADFPFPSCLLLGWIARQPVNVVAAQVSVSGNLHRCYSLCPRSFAVVVEL